MSPRSLVIGRQLSALRPQRVALALASILAGAACSPATNQESPAAACPTALIRGTLEVLGTDIGLFDTNSRHLLVDWPEGFTTRDVAGQPSLVDAAGVVVARAGDRVEIPGGEKRVGEWYACGAPIVRQITVP